MCVLFQFWPILKSSAQYDNPVEKVSGIAIIARERRGANALF